MKRKITYVTLMLLFFVIAAGTAEATLRIRSGTFSCTGQAGVKLGEIFACQATVENPDTGTASISAVTLNINGNWLEQTSYAGSGFDTSLASGATTTVTFSGLRSTASGVNGFTSIRIDDVTDTEAASTTVNVIDVSSLALVNSVSSTTQSSEFTVSATVTAGGSIDATIAISGCTLASGETATKNLGSISHGAQASASWGITMGSSTCSYSVTATATKGGATTTRTSSSSVTCSDCSSGGGSDSGSSGSSSGGGGGGGGGSSKAECYDNKDNDGDGLIDYPYDPGCTTENDKTEKETVCTEDWTCTSWGTCNGGKQTRSCVDANNCAGKTVDVLNKKEKPAEEQACSAGAEGAEAEKKPSLAEAVAEKVAALKGALTKSTAKQKVAFVILGVLIVVAVVYGIRMWRRKEGRK